MFQNSSVTRTTGKVPTNFNCTETGKFWRFRNIKLYIIVYYFILSGEICLTNVQASCQTAVSMGFCQALPQTGPVQQIFRPSVNRSISCHIFRPQGRWSRSNRIPGLESTRMYLVYFQTSYHTCIWQIFRSCVRICPDTQYLCQTEYFPLFGGQWLCILKYQQIYKLFKNVDSCKKRRQY